MVYFNRILFSIILFATVITAKSQDIDNPQTKNPPIFMEAFAGNRSLNYQVIIDKKLQSIPRIGFFGVNYIQPEWGESKMTNYMIQGNITYSIIRGINLSSGFIWNPFDGIRPSSGVILTYGNPKLLVLINPRVDLTKNSNFDALSLIKFKPKLTEKLNLYTKVQGLYTHNLGFDFHTRSYVMLRAGITYNDISFGAATNFDWYGPMKINKNNVGGFVAVNLY